MFLFTFKVKSRTWRAPNRFASTLLHSATHQSKDKNNYRPRNAKFTVYISQSCLEQGISQNNQRASHFFSWLVKNVEQLVYSAVLEDPSHCPLSPDPFFFKYFYNLSSFWASDRDSRIYELGQKKSLEYVYDWNAEKRLLSPPLLLPEFLPYSFFMSSNFSSSLMFFLLSGCNADKVRWGGNIISGPVTQFPFPLQMCLPASLLIHSIYVSLLGIYETAGGIN